MGGWGERLPTGTTSSGGEKRRNPGEAVALSDDWQTHLMTFVSVGTVVDWV